MLTIKAPAADQLDGERLRAQLADAGLRGVALHLVGDELIFPTLGEADRAKVTDAVAAHMSRPALVDPVPTLAELAAEVRGMKRAAAAEAAKTTTTAKGVAAAIAADSA